MRVPKHLDLNGSNKCMLIFEDDFWKHMVKTLKVAPCPQIKYSCTIWVLCLIEMQTSPTCKRKTIVWVGSFRWWRQKHFEAEKELWWSYMQDSDTNLYVDLRRRVTIQLKLESPTRLQIVQYHHSFHITVNDTIITSTLYASLITSSANPWSSKDYITPVSISDDRVKGCPKSIPWKRLETTPFLLLALAMVLPTEDVPNLMSLCNYN